jgi:hypothetical protein
MHYLLNSLQRAKMELSLMQPFLCDVVHFARWSHRSHLAFATLQSAGPNARDLGLDYLARSIFPGLLQAQKTEHKLRN